jgi:hypothetical protein
MPTESEVKELLSNCNSEWISQNGVDGMRHTSKINGKSIFIPASGFYDGTTLRNNTTVYCWINRYWNSSYARIIYENANTNTYQSHTKYYGCQVRAVL